MIAEYIGGQRKHGPIAYASRVVPGMTRNDLASLFAVPYGYRCGAEIGVADGRYSLTLCESILGLRLFCVDPWQAYHGNPRGGPQPQHDKNLALARVVLAPYDVALIQAYSMDAVRNVPPASLDFVYIDGNHGFDYVMQDLIEWSKRVKSGGIVAGHDFYDFEHAGVIAAVVAYTAAHGIKDWHLCDEREPSFWWIKP